MQLFVFAKQSLQARISNVQFSVENTGFLHVFPNKVHFLDCNCMVPESLMISDTIATLWCLQCSIQYHYVLSYHTCLLTFCCSVSLQGGILVTLQVDGTKLAFISCHLTAHEVRLFPSQCCGLVVFALPPSATCNSLLLPPKPPYLTAL